MNPGGPARPFLSVITVFAALGRHGAGGSSIHMSHVYGRHRLYDRTHAAQASPCIRGRTGAGNVSIRE